MTFAELRLFAACQIMYFHRHPVRLRPHDHNSNLWNLPHNSRPDDSFHNIPSDNYRNLAYNHIYPILYKPLHQVFFRECSGHH
jgi:hypothetical protein